MLFFFRGKNGFLVRAIIGALLVVLGLAIHGGVILAAIGLVLILWGGVGMFAGYRARRGSQVGTGHPVR